MKNPLYIFYYFFLSIYFPVLLVCQQSLFRIWSTFFWQHKNFKSHDFVQKTLSSPTPRGKSLERCVNISSAKGVLANFPRLSVQPNNLLLYFLSSSCRIVLVRQSDEKMWGWWWRRGLLWLVIWHRSDHSHSLCSKFNISHSINLNDVTQTG